MLGLSETKEYRYGSYPWWKIDGVFMDWVLADVWRLGVVFKEVF